MKLWGHYTTTNERKLLKTQLVCTFARKYEIEETLINIKKKFDILNNKIFLMKTISPQSEMMLSYNIKMEMRQDFLPKSIMVHRKKETNTIYTINALNELIMEINNGVLDKQYPIDWEKYENSILLKKQDGLKILKIEVLNVYSV